MNSRPTQLCIMVSQLVMYSVQRQITKIVKPIIVEVQINGRPVHMELDTGSAVTILNEKMWKETLNRPKATMN